jgi:uncharacterized integral membrane protein (TIGR00697 family)
MSNLAVGLISFFLFIIVVLAAARMGKIYLFGLSISFILISNITVQMNVEVVPRVVISWAIIIYSLVYLITDFVIEFYGRPTAYRLAAVNLIVQYILWIYVWLSMMVVPVSADTSNQVYETMRALFGTTTQVTVAATVAALGPFSDIFVTGKLRDYLKVHRLFKHEILNLLARAKLSTLIGELINTLLFFGIVLLGTGTDIYTQVSIIVSATIVKWVIAILDAPFLYLFFRHGGEPADRSEGHHIR